MKRPLTCLDDKCETVTFITCPMCINRSIIANKGYLLIQAIEACAASEAQTNAVILASEFIKLAEKEVAAQKTAEGTAQVTTPAAAPETRREKFVRDSEL